MHSGWKLGAAGLVAALAIPLATSATPTHNGKAMPDRVPDRTWEGRLEEGKPIPLDWATGTNVGCWPATENRNFDGHHVIRSDVYGPDMDLFVRVTPEPGVDISLYTLRIAPDDEHVPPAIYRASCQASYDRKGDNNPGVSEGVQVRGSHRYRVIVGVAGTDGAARGGYRLDIWDESAK